MDQKPIILEDNNYQDREDDYFLSEAEIDKLSRYDGLPLNKICEENPSLLLYPNCFGANGDKIEDPLYKIKDRRLKVGNVVGFWGVDGVNVRVHSRFDDENRQYFFHYMLQRIAGVNVLDFKTLPNPENIGDFLVYLFPMAFKQAMRQGVLRAYRVFRHNDDRIRGKVDVSMFIRCDIPFAGKVAYNTREHTANNHVLHLIRHTIELIRRTTPVLLTVDLEMRQDVDTIMQMTPDYADRMMSRIIAANLRPVRHPLYSAYTGLQNLCLQILRHENISFGESDGNISGIVFDAAWLWEEYLNKVFGLDARWRGMVHPRNKEEENSVPIYLNNNTPVFYPDFYELQRKIVLDAKYKFVNKKDRNDLFQIISYLHILKCQAGVLLKPDKAKTDYYKNGTLVTGETIGESTLKIPCVDMCSNYQDFVEQISKEERMFIDKLLSL